MLVAAEFMDWPGSVAMFGGKNSHFNLKLGRSVHLSDRSNCWSTCSVMAFKLEQTKSTSLSFSYDIVCLALSSEYWSLKIPLSDAYHELPPSVPCLVCKTSEADMCFTSLVKTGSFRDPETTIHSAMPASSALYCPILPGLPDDVAKYCLALVPRSYFPAIGAVCKRWRSYVQSKEFVAIRKEAGKLEEWLYVLTTEGKGSQWEVISRLEDKQLPLPPMPGPVKAGFGVVVVDGKLLVIAGYLVDVGTTSVCSDVFQYDSRLNRWSTLKKMNVARFDFACAEVNGLVYAVGGYGSNGESLSTVEVYNPETNEWTLIESLRRPRWGCFACGFEGKLYIMGGRSSFTIGNTRFIDVYNPECHSWCEMKNGCVMVTAHAVLDRKLFCVEWKNQRKLSIFDSADNSWKSVPIPLGGSMSVGFRFGILDGKLLLFSLKGDPGYQTLLYDPDAPSGSEWKISPLKPSGLCLCTATITA